jgi:hypothetical protein
LGMLTSTATRFKTLLFVVLHDGNPPIPVPDFQIVTVEHLSGFRLGFFVAGTIKLVDL